MSPKVTNPTRVPKNAVLLSKVSTLTLRDGKLTASRRVRPVQQLECVGPSDICNLYKVDVMRCTNEGADYEAENIQWSCKASLPEEFKLGSTDVICEGYESSEDPYVLKGSCGVEYRLLLTDKGEQKFGSQYGSSPIHRTSDKINTGFGFVFSVIFVVVLFIILKGMWTNWNLNPPRRGGPRPIGGATNNNNDDDGDPPPPYDGPPPYYNQPRKVKTQGTSSRTTIPGTSSAQSSVRRDGQQGQNWRPGFWTGTAAGAAAGYLFSNRGQTRTEARQNPLQPETQQRPGGFFSNFGASRQQNRHAPAPAAPPSSSSPSSSYSPTRHESTGFGSTRRR